jgi:spermidine/putrescine transport system permease protein
VHISRNKKQTKAPGTIKSGGSDSLVFAERRELKRRWLLVSPTLLIIGCVGILPLTIILVYSFMTPGPFAGVEWKFTFEAWINLFLERDIFDDTLGINYAHLTIFARSVGLALTATLLTLIIGFPTAYFIATRPVQKRNFWLFLISLPFWSNLLVRTFAMMLFVRDKGFINYVLIKLNIIENPLHILYTNTAIGIGLVYAYLPLMVMPLYASMEKLDFRLVEAGFDLYANRFKVLLRLIIPLVKPGIVAGCILVFIPTLGAYVTPRILGGGKNLMLGSLIANQFSTSRDWPLGSVLSLSLMAIVMIALMVYVQYATRNQRNE